MSASSIGEPAVNLRQNSPLVHLVRRALHEWGNQVASDPIHAVCYCADRSFGAWLRSSPLRIRCIWLWQQPRFNTAVDVTILVCTIALMINTPKWFPEDSTGWVIFNILDMVFSVLFTIELTINGIANGFVYGSTAVLQTSWGKLDTVVVVSSWGALLSFMPDFKAGRALRTLRVLRSLRVLKSLRACKWTWTTLSALGLALQGLIDNGKVLVFFSLVYGALGLSLFRGSLRQRCVSYDTCEEMVPQLWCSRDTYGTSFNSVGVMCPVGFRCSDLDNPNEGYVSFDNIFSTLLTIFQCMTLEGWSVVMRSTQQAAGPWAWVYFLFLLLIFPLMTINLFVAVISASFSVARREEADELIRQKEALVGALTPSSAARHIKKKRLSLQRKPVFRMGPKRDTGAATDSKAQSPASAPPTSTVPIGMHLNPLRTDSESANGSGASSGKESGVSVRIEGSACQGWLRCGLSDVADLRARGEKALGLKPGSVLAVLWDEYEPSVLTDKEVMSLQPGDKLLFRMTDEELAEDACMPLGVSQAIASAITEDNGAGVVPLEMVVDVSDESSTSEAPPDTPPSNARCWCVPLMWIWARTTPEEASQEWIGRVIAHGAFEPTIMGLVCVNAVFMAMPYGGQPDSYKNILDVADLVFTGIFVVEALTKMYGLGGLKHYFAEAMNVFDFGLVVLSLSSSVVSVSGLRGLRAVRAARMLRSLRTLRMLRVMVRVERLYMVFSGSGAAIATQLGFIFYIMAIMALIGMQCFDQTEEDGEPLGRTINFDTFGNAMLTVFTGLTLEGWTEKFVQCANIDPVLAIFFWMVFIVLVVWTLSEMLVAVIVEKFEISEHQREMLQQRVHGIEQHSLQLLRHTKLKSRSRTQSRARLLKHDDPPVEEESSKLEDVPSVADLFLQVHQDARKDLEYTPEELYEDVPSMSGSQAIVEVFEHDRIVRFVQERADTIGAAVIKRWLWSYMNDPVRNAFFEMCYAFRLHQRTHAALESEVEKSFFVLDLNHPFRKQCKNIAHHPALEWVLLVVIFASCVVLALDTPNDRTRRSGVSELASVANIFFFVVFAVEMLLRVAADGFYGKPKAYLGDAMNRLDFLVLCGSAVAIGFEGLAGVRLFRVVRCMRPLRMVSKTRDMRVVLMATTSVIPETTNIMLLFSFFTFLFATVGLSLFVDEFAFCTMEAASGKSSCLGTYEHTSEAGTFLAPSAWTLPRQNFENIGESIVALMEVSSTEGWISVLYSGIDIAGVDRQPIQNNEPANALFFVSYLLLTQIIVLSLLAAIIIDRFNTVSGKGILTEKQRNFKVVTQAILTEPKPVTLEVPDMSKQCVRHVCFHLVRWRYWDTMLFFLLMANAIVLVMPYYDMSDTYEDSLRIAEHALTFLFLIELVVRIIAVEWAQFQRDAWNRFDAAIVLLMVAISVLTLALGAGAFKAIGCVRLLLLARIVNRYSHSVRTILVTLNVSIPPLCSVLSMILMFFFMYSVLGMTFFSTVKHGEYLTQHYNFETFDRGMITLLRMITGEDWNGIMHDCMVQPPDCIAQDVTVNGFTYQADCGNPAAAYVIFLSFYFLGSFILLTLFLAVIADCFQTCNAMKASGMEQRVFDRYGQIWNEFTVDSKPPYKWLFTHQLYRFMVVLGAPLGLSEADIAEGASRKFKRISGQVRYSIGTTAELPNERKTTKVSYRKLLWLLSQDAGEDDAIPFSERVAHQDARAKIGAVVALGKLGAKWRGGKTRRSIQDGSYCKEDPDSTEANQQSALWKRRAAMRTKNARALSLSTPELGNTTLGVDPTMLPSGSPPLGGSMGCLRPPSPDSPKSPKSPGSPGSPGSPYGSMGALRRARISRALRRVQRNNGSEMTMMQDSSSDRSDGDQSTTSSTDRSNRSDDYDSDMSADVVLREKERVERKRKKRGGVHMAVTSFL